MNMAISVLFHRFPREQTDVLRTQRVTFTRSQLQRHLCGHYMQMVSPLLTMPNMWRTPEENEKTHNKKPKLPLLFITNTLITSLVKHSTHSKYGPPWHLNSHVALRLKGFRVRNYCYSNRLSTILLKISFHVKSRIHSMSINNKQAKWEKGGI